MWHLRLQLKYRDRLDGVVRYQFRQFILPPAPKNISEYKNRSVFSSRSSIKWRTFYYGASYSDNTRYLLYTYPNHWFSLNCLWIPYMEFRILRIYDNKKNEYNLNTIIWTIKVLFLYKIETSASEWITPIRWNHVHNKILKFIPLKRSLTVYLPKLHR